MAFLELIPGAIGTKQIVFIVLLGLILSFVVRRVYSVYFGPLSKFPGPKLAAATLWYEFYYDVILQGHYTFKIKELHEKYGPIIRISPNELHIDEPDYYEKLYSQHEPRDKSEYYLSQFKLPGSSFGTADYRHHRIRRGALNPFLSKQAIVRVEPMLNYMIDKLCNRINEFQKSGQPMPIRLVYSCLATDIVTLIVLNHNRNLLDTPDFSPVWIETVKAIAAAGHIMKQFPWLFDIIRVLPPSFVGAMNPGMRLLLDGQALTQQETRNVLEGKYKADKQYETLGLEKTIFHEILESDIPEEEKSFERLWQEAQVTIGAGSDTTGNAFTVTHFHLLDNPDILKKLQTELREALPNKYDTIELRVVEQLPYLNAVLNEGLRFSYGISTRSPRIHPTETVKFHQYEIPAGTPVGMTSVHIHHNETIFPESNKFKPERWLQKQPKGAPLLDRYLVSFSKGSRQCVGMQLAKAELQLGIATVFRRYENQELFETTRADVDIKHDLFLPAADLKSKGVRVIFK
ncbi:cytochrome P450 [Hyaloscypha variabilis F]|uniref:Cytochrome P450 n=1 Tax=Hyaloscypha variabilis (strain UAMH 11265 / GT02V1 / F) TaxID=1149755 RepID=A0A2J6RTZ4_HYAVF|nr:cytochrome P450 [Hyaloscypha variabilis F]